jgi:hypothetical protein
MVMEKGIIYGDRYSIKWIDESRDKGRIISLFQKGVKLTNPLVSNEIEVYFCRDCKKMIIDVSDKIE